MEERREDFSFLGFTSFPSNEGERLQIGPEIGKILLQGPISQESQKVVMTIQEENQDVISWFPELSHAIRVWGTIAELDAVCLWQGNFDQRTKNFIHWGVRFAIGPLWEKGQYESQEEFDSYRTAYKLFRLNFDSLQKEIREERTKGIFKIEEEEVRIFLSKMGIDFLNQGRKKIYRASKKVANPEEVVVRVLAPIIERQEVLNKTA